jgi:serine/threonine protein kinase
MEAIPRYIGSYRVQDLLGQGGTALVYRAIDESSGRCAAIKVLHAHLRKNRVHVRRLLNEARAARLASHPGVIGVLDSGVHEQCGPYLVLELLEGISLSTVLKRHRLDHQQVAALVAQVGLALHAVHLCGIVHRDIKPSNIFITNDSVGCKPCAADLQSDPQADPAALTVEDLTAAANAALWSVRLVDFGLARIDGMARDVRDAPESPLPLFTHEGEIIGTPSYMSPEHCQGAALVDRRSDIYSFGVVIHEMLAGKPPFSRI